MSKEEITEAELTPKKLTDKKVEEQSGQTGWWALLVFAIGFFVSVLVTGIVFAVLVGLGYVTDSSGDLTFGPVVALTLFGLSL